MLSIFWFRRDLRLMGNTALYHALQGNVPVMPIFIFDTNILDDLPKNDPRIGFIYSTLQKINSELVKSGGGVKIFTGSPTVVWKSILKNHVVKAVYFNKDYEPYAKERDQAIMQFLQKNGVKVYTYKDQVIFEENEIVKKDGKPYTVFSPYKRKWLEHFVHTPPPLLPPLKLEDILQQKQQLPMLKDIGFTTSQIQVKNFDISVLPEYEKTRNFPALDTTSYLSVHLRFGTVSIREIVTKVYENTSFLSELIWREFFMQILFHFPHVISENFKPQYNGIQWRNNKTEFKLWCEGKTGFPFVDAGMRQLNQTGYMHNRVRMVTAGFLCKHLLIQWQWGEAYFAKKLLDFELASNNGNWQWAAGTGCDAAPYFRVFNPTEQLKKFDPDLRYVKKWLPEYGTSAYPTPIVDHKTAREWAIQTYKRGIIKR